MFYWVKEMGVRKEMSQSKKHCMQIFIMSFRQMAILCKNMPLKTHGIVKDGTADSWFYG